MQSWKMRMRSQFMWLDLNTRSTDNCSVVLWVACSDGSRSLQQWKISVAISFPGWFVVGRIKKEFKIVLFLSVVGNRDVWCVACLFAKLVFFLVSPSSSIVTWLLLSGSDEIDPLVVEQALLKCFKALWSAEFSVVWRLGDTNKWTFFWKAKALSCVKEWRSARNSWWLCFPALNG